MEPGLLSKLFLLANSVHRIQELVCSKASYCVKARHGYVKYLVVESSRCRYTTNRNAAGNRCYQQEPLHIYAETITPNRIVIWYS